MVKWEIVKRTFEANKFPKGSTARKKLNKNPITSQYSPSDKFIVYKDGRRFDSYRTKKMAQFAISLRK